MKNKHLVAFFLLSVATFFGLRQCDFLPKKTSQGPLLALDTTEIHRFSVQFLGKENFERSWQRVGSNWKMTADGRTFSIQKEAAGQFFEIFLKAKIVRIVSKSKADFRLFSIEDSTAARLEFFGKTGRSLGSILLGGSSKNASGETISFARFSTSTDVFELLGEPSKWLAQHPKSFRINELCRFSASKTTALTFTQGSEKPLTIWRGKDGNWTEASNQKSVSPSQIDRLFRALEKAQKGFSQVDDFDEMKKSGAFVCQLLVASDSANASFSLDGWRPRGQRDFILRGSQQPDAFFRVPDSLARAIFSRPIF